jgi:hypothetical protein
VIVALPIATMAVSGFGLIAWWARDMLAARRGSGPTAAPVRPGLQFHGPGLSPETVADAANAGRSVGGYGE